MDDASLLLTDEFVAFAEKVKAIHEEKKAKKLELKQVYDRITNEVKALDAKAKELEEQFAAWKAAQGKGKSSE